MFRYEQMDESGLELGLKLGFSSEKTNKMMVFTKESHSSIASSSSSSSSYLNKPATGNQVVGWPPLRAYRMNSMVNQVKYPSGDECQPMVEKCKSKNDNIDMISCVGDKNYITKEQGQIKKSNFIKVTKDGNGIGRKVDLSAHSCYETLARTMEDMFSGVCTTRKSSVKGHYLMVEATGSSKLLDGSSEFVLTYEDKDGDWMLVGDVPWGMFINSVKRLRIMRTAEANGLGSKFQVRNVGQSLPI